MGWGTGGRGTAARWQPSTSSLLQVMIMTVIVAMMGNKGNKGRSFWTAVFFNFDLVAVAFTQCATDDR